MAAVLRSFSKSTDWERNIYFMCGQPKIALKSTPAEHGNSADIRNSHSDMMLGLAQHADELELNYSMTKMSGTECVQVLAIGPNKSSDIDTVTKHLKLL